eukprot:TRINITY_DN12040_c0_g1_i5.p1 TRINITY_DN12040_c0_g1~~TRINITY_DN12040_c0_g1_i5.p1  ORF type:complete len:361 (+),score=76.45 TRINITY_DN12040_c0_g1_i5:68-1150(+)
MVMVKEEELEYAGMDDGAGGQSQELAPLLDEFFQRYPCDDRARDFLDNQNDDVKTKVVQSFEPRSQFDRDYSAKLTGYIRSLSQDATRKRPREEDTLVHADALLHNAAPAEVDMEAFRARYPMDERAWDFLSTSSGYVQARIIAEFKPRSENDADYSAAVTSFVKRTRVAEESALMAAAFGDAAASEGMSPGVAVEQLEEFKQRYPMDDRAWEFLVNASPDVQVRLLQEFKPRNANDTDYSPAITAFLKALSSKAPMAGRGGFSRFAQPAGPSEAELEAFRAKFPMDERAYSFLQGVPPHVQEDCLQRFQPKSMDDTDYSRFWPRPCQRRHSAVPAKRSAPVSLLSWCGLDWFVVLCFSL